MAFNIIDMENIETNGYEYTLNDMDDDYQMVRLAHKSPLKISEAVSVNDTNIYVSTGNWFQDFNDGQQVDLDHGYDVLFKNTGEMLGIVHSSVSGKISSGDKVGAITTNVSDATDGTYMNVAASSTSGIGTGLVMHVVVSGGAVTEIYTINDVNRGQDYEIGDTVTFNAAGIGSPSTNLILTLREGDTRNRVRLIGYSDLNTSSKTANGLRHILQGNFYVSSTTGTNTCNSLRFPSNGNADGACVSMAVDEDIYVMRVQLKDASGTREKDRGGRTSFTPFNHIFNYGSFGNNWRPNISGLLASDVGLQRDNRYSQLHFNSGYLRFSLFPDENTTLGATTYFSEKGRHWGDSVEMFYIFTLNEQDWHSNTFDGYSFTFDGNDHENPKLYLPFVFAGHYLWSDNTNADLGLIARGAAGARRLHPFADTYRYREVGGTGGSSDFNRGHSSFVGGTFSALSTKTKIYRYCYFY